MLIQWNLFFITSRKQIFFIEVFVRLLVHLRVAWAGLRRTDRWRPAGWGPNISRLTSSRRTVLEIEQNKSAMCWRSNRIYMEERYPMMSWMRSVKGWGIHSYQTSSHIWNQKVWRTFIFKQKLLFSIESETGIKFHVQPLFLMNVNTKSTFFSS